MSKAKTFEPLRCALLTISDKYTRATDTTGNELASALTTEGHALAAREQVGNDLYSLRAIYSQWIADPTIQVIISHGGTGFAAANVTVPALRPLLDQEIPGFGEIFRQLSFKNIGSASLQSQALGGLVNRTLVLAVPGSEGAARLAWEHLIQPQLDARQGPCNFVPHIRPVQLC